MVKVEIDVPEKIYDFLEAAMRFSKPFKDDESIQSHIRAYILRQVIDSIEGDVNTMSSTPLWSEEDLVNVYGLHEVDL
ncbi:MAG: hypothetical protein ACETWE_12825 [Candidatus Bathyarchaeia archaeon]